MASKNVIDEYFIKISADAKGVNNDVNKALEKIFANSKKMNAKLSALEVKLKGKTVTEKITKDKALAKTENALRKNKIAKEEASTQREIDLAKIAYKKKTAYIKHSVAKLTDSNNETLSSMKKYYTNMEKEAEKSFQKNLSKKKRDKSATDKHFKESIESLTSKNKKEIDDMRKYYLSLEKQAEKDRKAHARAEEAKTAKTKREIKERDRYANKIDSVKRTDYWDNIKAVNPRRSQDFEARMIEQARARDMKGLKDTAREMQKYSKEVSRSMKKVSFVQKGVTDSTKNMIRSYISLFAVFEGTRAIKNVGMDMESLDASMLAASKSQEDAARKMKFVKDTAYRLGGELKSSAKAYMQLSIAGKGVLESGDIDKLFVATLESATALGMSVDDTSGTFRSFVQMLSKGNVQAEELRGQLGERLYGAFNLAAKAMGITTQQLNKQLELGNVLAKDLLPKMTPLISQMANANGALATQLESARVAENRFFLQAQDAGKTVWKNGMNEGFKELYDTLEKLLKDSEPALKKFGATMGRVFKGIAHILKVMEPYFNLFISNLEIVTGAAMLGGIYKLSKGFTFLGAAIRVAVLPLTALLAGLEEAASLMSDKLVGNIEMAMGKQFNLLDLTQSELYKTKDGTLMSKAATPMSAEWLSGIGTAKSVWSKTAPLNPFASMTNLYSDISSFIGSDRTKGQSGLNTPNYVIENITIDAPTEDVAINTFNRIISAQAGR